MIRKNPDGSISVGMLPEDDAHDEKPVKRTGRQPKAK